MTDNNTTFISYVLNYGYDDLRVIEDMDNDFFYMCLENSSGDFSLSNILYVAVNLIKTHLIDTIEQRIEDAENEEDNNLASALEKLNPEEDFDYWINYSDTHIYLSNYNDYENLIPDELEYLEDQIGLEFNV